jgi:tetratricopeptide (TPR) repeat protein
MTPSDRNALLRTLSTALLVAAAGAVPYLGVLESPFVFDDVKLVKENRFLRPGGLAADGVVGILDVTDRRWDGEELRPNYRPVRFLSYLLDYRLSEWLLPPFPPGDPPVLFFHLTNLLLHVGNALLVWALVALVLRQLGASDGPPAALAAGLLYALHPLATEAVTYISGRRDVLSTFFFLAALAVYLAERPEARLRPHTFLAVPLLFAAGLLTKEMTITLPAALLLLDLARRARPNGPRVSLHLLLWCVAGVHIALTLLTPGLIQAGGARSPFAVAIDAARYGARYLGLALFPASQSVDYSFAAIPPSEGYFSPPTAIPSVILILALGALALRGLGLGALARWPRGGTAAPGDPGPRRPSAPGILAATGILWFLGTLVPALQLVPVAEAFAERFAYLPLVGIALVFAAICLRLLRCEPILSVGFGGIVCLVAFALSVRRNADWRSPLDLWTAAVEAQPRAARAHVGRANALKVAGRYREAIDGYTTALEIFEEKPQVPLHHGFILQALAQRGSLLGLLGTAEPELLPRAEADYRRLLGSRDVDGTSMGFSPRHTVLHFDLAKVLLAQGKASEAKAELERVIEIGEPASLVGGARYYLGKLLLAEGDRGGAVSSLRKAYDLVGKDDPVRYQVAAELADFLIEWKDLESAWKIAERGLADGANGRERLHLLYRKSKVLDRRGDLDGANGLLRGILAQDAGYAPALLTLSDIEANLGRFDEAEARLLAVRRGDPAWSEAQEKLTKLRLRRRLETQSGGAQEDPGIAVDQVLDALQRKARGHEERGEWIAARESFVHLLSRAREAGKRPLESTCLKGIAGIDERFGKHEDARRLLEEALRLEPADADTLRRLGDLALRRFDEREKALDLYRQYLAALPEGAPGDPLVHFNVGQLVGKQNPALALSHYEKARSGGLDARMVDRALGYLYAEVGEWVKSLEAFNRYFEATSEGNAPEREATRVFVNEHVLPRVLGG